MTVPANLRYTTDHEWLDLDGDVATVGITAYAADGAINADPYGAGWLFRARVTGMADLLAADAYDARIAGA